MLASRLAIGLAGRHAVTYWDDRLSCPVPLLSASGGVQLDQARLRLPDHRIDLDREPTTRHRLTAQLRRELPAGHVLTDTQPHMIARCTRCDDVLLKLDDHRYAIVHLTWRQTPEASADWPSTQQHLDPATLLADLTDRHLGPE